MVFKRLLGSLGVGGPQVDTVLQGGAAPGAALQGQVFLKGGSAQHEIEEVRLELVARVEAEYEHGEAEGVVAFEHFVVGGGFRLAEGEERALPFSVVLPWETPITQLHGQSLGVELGVRTELGVAGASDKSDLDALVVPPLPAQEAVLEALGRLGFAFKSADLELGHIRGTGQQLPFYQEIELTPPPQYAHACNEIEVTFLAASQGVEVVLEADKRGGLFGEGHDALGRYTVTHQDVGQYDWTGEVDGWVRRLLDQHASYGSGHGEGFGHGAHGAGGHSGPGAAVAAGAVGLAAGAAGGYVAAEIIDEIGDAFEDDEGDDDGGDEEE
ncbi:sporulation protein [Streptomyces sp. TR06-5]|uniref:sporulation protein n=1 Tax=unclassified Streptomyces TaxID=2593676 RepID=UPI0039A1CFEA